jgi:hypothetical protein
LLIVAEGAAHCDNAFSAPLVAALLSPMISSLSFIPFLLGQMLEDYQFFFAKAPPEAGTIYFEEKISCWKAVT